MNFIWADVFIRYSLSILFFFQAVDKLFVLGPREVIRTISRDHQKHRLPDWIIVGITYTNSIVELVFPLLLILGWHTQLAALVLGFNLLTVVFFFSWMNPLWDMKHVFPRLLLLILFFCLPESVNLFRLDNFLH